MTEYFTKDGDDYKKVDDQLMTQSEIESTFLPSRLQRERAKFADYDDLKEKAGTVDTIKSEYEVKLTAASSENTELTKQLGVAKLETDKVKIVSEFKLSDELAEFVTGDSVEDMRKRAEKLAKGVTGGGVVIDKEQKPSGDKTDAKALAGKLFRNKSDD